jgi:hypothetical protein
MMVSNTMVIYHGILTLEKVGTAVNYHGIFITLAKNTTLYFNPRKRRYHGKLPRYFYNIGPRFLPVGKSLPNTDVILF